MSEIKLTKKQLVKISVDMNEQVEMLNDAEVNALAIKVNKAINLPFISEEKEFVVFVKIIKWIDKKLYQLLPNEYYELINDATNGISKEEAMVIEERVTPMINNAVNLPVLTETQEEKLMSIILGLIINAMVKGFKLDEVEVQ